MNSDETFGRSHTPIGGEAQHGSLSAGPRLPVASKVDTPIGPAAVPDSFEWGKKTVLLVDSSLPSRESRAKVMRARGVRVDCVANAAAARVRLAAETYNLILVDPGRNVGAAESLVQEIRVKNSRQLVRFLVGSPLFIAKSLGGHKHEPLPVASPAAIPEAPSAPVSTGFDFGQKIKDAEAEEIQ